MKNYSTEILFNRKYVLCKRPCVRWLHQNLNKDHLVELQPIITEKIYLVELQPIIGEKIYLVELKPIITEKIYLVELKPIITEKIYLVELQPIIAEKFYKVLYDFMCSQARLCAPTGLCLFDSNLVCLFF